MHGHLSAHVPDHGRHGDDIQSHPLKTLRQVLSTFNYTHLVLILRPSPFSGSLSAWGRSQGNPGRGRDSGCLPPSSSLRAAQLHSEGPGASRASSRQGWTALPQPPGSEPVFPGGAVGFTNGAQNHLEGLKLYLLVPSPKALGSEFSRPHPGCKSRV